MREAAEAPPSPRPGRCATHPGAASVGTCVVCGRALCIRCATPVRGRPVGPECLSAVVQDAPPVRAEAGPISRRGDLIAGAGFLTVLVLSVFPWSRGAFSGFFGAWSGNWSLLAGLASLAGLLVAAASWWRPRHQGLAAALCGALSVGTGAAAILHRVHPPVLSEPSLASGLALVGAGIALAGAAAQGLIAVRRRRS